MASSGIHSNGLTLAREALFSAGQFGVDSMPEGFQHSIGEELLTPTRIYVRPAMQMINRLEGLRALAHITSDGFLNLLRIPGSFAYDIESLPPTPPIFELISRAGSVAPEEMYRVYNMGIGMCAVVSSEAVDEALSICRSERLPAWRIGTVRSSAVPEVYLKPAGLVGRGKSFMAI
jgi:phosphoribosylformylglycinamidine cyclo-ligase